MDIILSGTALHCLIMTGGIIFYFASFNRIITAKIRKMLFYAISVPLVYASLFFSSMLPNKPLSLVSAFCAVLLICIFIIRYPPRVSVHISVCLLFYYLYSRNLCAAASSLLLGKNIFHLMSLPQASSTVLLITSAFFTAFMVGKYFTQNVTAARVLVTNRELFYFLMVFNSLITLFMLYTCFDYYLNTDYIWPTVWQIVSALIMMSAHMLVTRRELKTALLLQYKIRRERQSELLETQQAYISDMKESASRANALHHNYSEALLTIDYLLKTARTDQISPYIEQAQAAPDSFSAEHKEYSNNAVLNSLLFFDRLGLRAQRDRLCRPFVCARDFGAANRRFLQRDAGTAEECRRGV